MSDALKRCTSCGEELPATEEFFHRDRHHARDGLRCQCKDCATARTKKWQAEHYAEYRVRKATYDAAHREERRAYDAVRGAAYYAEHRAEYRARNRNRRARLYGNGGTHTAADIRAQLARQRGRCFWGPTINPDCARTLKKGYHVDHVIPLVDGGSNGPENLVLACPSCNRKKSVKHPMEWAGVLF